MIVTEEEAKTKRCQESFGDGNVTPTGHMVAVQMTAGAGYAIGTSPSMCIGSACMAWRWKRDNLYQPVDARDKLPKDHANYADFILMEGAGDYSATHGFCGKAGKP